MVPTSISMAHHLHSISIQSYHQTYPSRVRSARTCTSFFPQTPPSCCCWNGNISSGDFSMWSIQRENPLSYLLSIDGFNFLIYYEWNDLFDNQLLQPLSRIVQIPQDLEWFKDFPMYVKYVTEEAATESSKESGGVFHLASLDLESSYCRTWNIADVRKNREQAGRGRPLSRKQREWQFLMPLIPFILFIYASCNFACIKIRKSSSANKETIDKCYGTC